MKCSTCTLQQYYLAVVINTALICLDCHSECGAYLLLWKLPLFAVIKTTLLYFLLRYLLTVSYSLLYLNAVCAHVFCLDTTNLLTEETDTD